MIQQNQNQKKKKILKQLKYLGAQSCLWTRTHRPSCRRVSPSLHYSEYVGKCFLIYWRMIFLSKIGRYFEKDKGKECTGSESCFAGRTVLGCGNQTGDRRKRKCRPAEGTGFADQGTARIGKQSAWTRQAERCCVRRGDETRTGNWKVEICLNIKKKPVCQRDVSTS